MSLANLYTELHRAAARSGTDRALDLKGGARLAVRVQNGVTTLTIARKAKKVGDTELITFKRDCGVPSDAVRFPSDAQGTREYEGSIWYYITYRWAEGVDQ
jgi:hypothetical protein